LSTSRSEYRTAARYAAFAAFCFLFFLIYDRFSHNVRSFYMTFLWLWPFALGFVPSLTAAFAGRMHFPDIYHYGVICITVSSLLRGIFEIAGTSSVYQTILFLAGWIMLAAGVILFGRIASSRKTDYYYKKKQKSLRIMQRAQNGQLSEMQTENETEPDPENLRNRL